MTPCPLQQWADVAYRVNIKYIVAYQLNINLKYDK